ncbi:MAG: hypothetical protein ABIN17_03495 [candidate division WOR-3 bacterium]
MKKIILIFVLVFLNSRLFAQKEVPFTLEDRDRLIRIETSLKEFKEYTEKRFEQIDKRFEQIEKRFEQIERRFDQIIHIFIGIVAAFAGIVAVTIGFAIWDRRTALQPYLKINKEIKEREEIILKILKEYSKKNPELAEIIKNFGL